MEQRQQAKRLTTLAGLARPVQHEINNLLTVIFANLEMLKRTAAEGAPQRQLDRGQRMVELLKQPQYRPYHVNEQVISIFAGANGFLDDLPVSEVLKFEAALLKHIQGEHPEILEELDRTRDLSKELAEKLRTVLRDFKTHAKATA